MYRFVLVLLVALMSTLVLYGCDLASQSEEEHIAEAKLLRDQGEFNAAIIELKSALQQNPGNSEARFMLGSLYVDMGEGESAEKELGRALELGLEPQFAVIPLARAYLIQNNYSAVLESSAHEDALTDQDRMTLLTLRGDAQLGLRNSKLADEMYDLALEINENSVEASLGKARVAVAERRWAKARKWVDRVLQLDVKAAPAWSLLGDIEFDDRNPGAALEAYGNALQINPANVAVLAKSALIRIDLKEYEQASNHLSAATKVNKSHPLVNYAYGQLFFRQEDYAQAITSFEQVLERTPTSVPARYLLAVSQLREGQLELAYQNARIVKNQFPEFAGPNKLLAAIKVSQGDYPGAQEILEDVLTFNPEDSWALNLSAEISVRMDESGQAIEGFRKLVALNPESEIAQLKLALSLLSANDREAIDVLNDVSKFENRATQAKYLTMVSHLQANEWDKAIAVGEELVEGDPGNWDALTLLGGAYFANGDLDLGRQKFKEALEIRPGNPNAALNLARLELLDGNSLEARRLYTQILEQNPGHPQTVATLVRLDLQEKKPQDAIDRLKGALVQRPEELAFRVELARLYVLTGQPSLALDLLKEIGEEHTTNPVVLRVSGDAHAAHGEYEGASRAYEQLVEIMPDDAWPLFRLAQIYAAMNRLTDARRALDRLNEIQPDFYSAQVMRIRLLRLEKKEPEAIELVKKFDEKYSNQPEFLIEKGWLALYQNKSTEAVQAFERAFELKPGSDVIVQLGMAKWQAGDTEGTLRDAREWLDANPKDTKVLFHLANSYLQLGRNQEARETYKKLVELKPSDPVVLNNLAWLLREEDPKKAIQYAEQATELAPEWGAALDTLGTILLDRGKHEEAFLKFQLASRKAPNDPDIAYHLALASSRMGDKEQASEILKEILADPNAKFESRTDAEKLLVSLNQ